MKTVILVNVGTPESTTPEDVGIYLNEFLMDENIITIPRPLRDILVKLLIVPRRKFASAEKYKKIWTDQGSPLLVNSKKLQRKLQAELGAGWNVEIAMQVGKPALKKVLGAAAGTEIYFCPLYPQFATATTGGALKSITKMQTHLLKPFFAQDWFIKSQAQIIRENLKPHEHLLLSYHGLPVSQLKSHRSECYKNASCCLSPEACEMNCYKAQCLKTSERLVRELGHKNVSTSFQSRLGPAKWIEPSTQQTVKDLLANGVKHLKVACPSFVADCLETLEEIGIELKQQFMEGGGESFELIPCVNDSGQFVNGLAANIRGLSQ